MNTQTTPLVQKLILVTLVLILGCMVLMLVNSRKQIEGMREGNNPAMTETDSNSVPSIHRAFPSMRSSRNLAPAQPVPEPVQTPTTQPTPAPQHVEAPIVEQPPPYISTSGTVVEPVQVVAPVSGVFGQVLLVGVPPQEKIIKFDQTCGAVHPTLVTTRHYVVSPDGGLANVFVYISKGPGVDGKRFKTPTAPVLIDQKDCVYEPYVIGAMVNQPIQIRNSDPILHNVHALPKVDGNNEFNFAQPLQDQIDQRAFPKPEVFIKLKCEVHDWMFAYVGVASNPYFAVTDTNGIFHLPDGLPPGGYEITATHLKAGSAKQRFVLKKNGAVTLQFQMKVAGSGGVVQR
jgi:hypothetical protein